MDYLERVNDGLVIFDGGAGTTFQAAGLTMDDFGGEKYEGCNENLNLTSPNTVRAFHEGFLLAGADVIETNTFGAFELVLREYDLEDSVYEINLRGAEIAREMATSFESSDHQRFVAGSMGPGTRLPTLGQIAFAELRDQYQAQAQGLLDGGVDLLLIETSYDLLATKAAIAGSRRAIKVTGRSVPLQVQVTMEISGQMLVGTDIAVVQNALAPLHLDVIGLNCGTGPAEMIEHLRYLSRYGSAPISVMPNAGLPSIVDGKMHYDLTPIEFAEYHEKFIKEFGASIVGGCCGTTPDHIEALVSRCRELPTVRRDREQLTGVSSTYSFAPYDQSPSFLVVGERTNANGSKKFRDAMLGQQWDICVAMARDQVEEGAHVVDLCVDYTGADGVTDMGELAFRFNTDCTLPVMLDSTEPDVIETALQHIAGRPILNSVNLEEGDGPGTRLDRFLKLAAEYGAAVVCTTIDTEGQARTAEWKLRAAKAIYDIAVDRYGLSPSDLIFDPLALPLSTGMEESRRDGIETIEGIRRIKAEIPGVLTILGLSNVSFGLNPAARQVLNSVFLHECTQAGLDAAIVHAAKIIPLARIDDHTRQVCLDLIYDRRSEGYDPLSTLLELFEGASTVMSKAKEDRSSWHVGLRLERRIIEGDRNGLREDLDEAMSEGIAPLTIINEILLPSMRIVGEYFASGEMQLPFVLGSAETMKAAVAHLEPHMEKSDQGGKGTIVLATVKGDVHDIGKNLVDIIFTNNGYSVRNLGIKVPISEIVTEAQAAGADAIGMSGLLVKSTLIMRDNLDELNRLGLSSIPVILGGAALTRTYVERDLRSIYNGRLFYGKDAFEGLHTMDRLTEIRRSGEDDPEFGRKTGGRNLGPRKSEQRRQKALEAIQRGETMPSRSPSVVTDNELFQPPFMGSRIAKGVLIEDISKYLNETALFRNQWGFRPKSGEPDAEFKERIRGHLRVQLADAIGSQLLQPQVAWGHFPANSDGNDLVLFTDETRSSELMRFTFPRQAEDPWLCISDFYRSVESGQPDYASFQVVTMGPRVSEEAARRFSNDEYQSYLYLHGLGVEMAEALTELWHRRIREDLGFASEDGPSLSGLFRQKYRGGRYSWGYPACPNLEDNEKVVQLVRANEIGISVSEGFQLHPEQSTTAIVCHHPQAKYFVV